MLPYLRILALCSTSFIGATAWAQAPVPPAPSPGVVAQVPLFDPQQLPAYKGTVQQFTLTPRGDIDGIIMADGTEVKVPPHLSTQIAYVIKPGDAVTVRGLRAASLPLISASSITNDASGSVVVDTGPGMRMRKPGPPPPPTGGSIDPRLTTIQGRVKLVLHGPQGEVNGALLEDRTVLRLPLQEALRFAPLLAPGQAIAARGYVSANALGTLLEIRALGSSPDQLSEIAGSPPGPPGRGGKGRRPPPLLGVGFAPPPPPRP